MTTIGLARPGTHVATTTVWRWVGMMAAAVHRELRQRREVAWLMQQDDRMLSDLGLSRHDINRVVRHGRDV